MDDFRLEANFKKPLDDILKKVHVLPEQVNLATKYALNRTARWFKSHASREVSKRSRIRLKLIRPLIRIRGATNYKLASNLNWDIDGIYFAYLDRVRQDDIGLVDAGAKHRIPHGFIAKLRNEWGSGTYVRKGKDRFPIQRAKVPIDKEATEETRKLLNRQAEEYFVKRFDHEIERTTGILR